MRAESAKTAMKHSALIEDDKDDAGDSRNMEAKQFDVREVKEGQTIEMTMFGAAKRDVNINAQAFAGETININVHSRMSTNPLCPIVMEVELPRGWVKQYDQETMSTYYEHPESGATQWARPTSVTASAAQWELHYDAKRNTYFHNNETGESSWELPAGAALLTMREDSVDDDADAVQGAGEASFEASTMDLESDGGDLKAESDGGDVTSLNRGHALMHSMRQIGIVRHPPRPPLLPRSKAAPPRSTTNSAKSLSETITHCVIREFNGDDEAGGGGGGGGGDAAVLSKGRRHSLNLSVHIAIEQKGRKATAYRHFFDNDFRPQYYWFRQLHFTVLFLLNVLHIFLSGLPARAAYAFPLFFGTQLVLAIYFVVLLWFRPMLHDESWKLPTKLGAILVSAVGTTLNLLATVDEPSFTGFNVDRSSVHRAFIAANVAFLCATCLLIAMMLLAFVLLLLFGGDDMLPRICRVSCVLNRWLCEQFCARYCSREDDVEAERVEEKEAEPVQVFQPQEHVEEEVEEEESDDDVFDYGAPLPLPLPPPPPTSLRRKSTLFDLLGSLRVAAKPQPAGAPLPQQADAAFFAMFEDSMRRIPSTKDVTTKKKTRKKKVKLAPKRGAIETSAAEEMRVRATQHDRLHGDWLSMRDAISGRRFYHNERTNASQWHAPSSNVV